MSNQSVITNKFDPRKTKTVIIHDGRFHADDVMFAAMALAIGKKYRNQINIIRSSEVPTDYSEDVVIGDLGLGVYDHHSDINGNKAMGSHNDNEDHVSAACGLLYNDIKNYLFPGDSETKKLFEAFIDIIEHCDVTPDNNTFSDSIGFFAPIDETKMDVHAMKAIEYCKAIVVGFMEAHEKERSGKIWAVPKICAGIVPGVQEKKDQRYWKATSQIKNRYRYVSFNNKTEIKLRSMDTYSLACGVLNYRKRQQWRDEIERADAEQIKEMERREREDWPKALSEMKHRTIVLDKYLPYGQYIKEIPALFIVTESQRGGYSVTILKTNTGKPRFEPDLLLNFEGVTFVATDKRFVVFDTKEHALNAAYQCGETVTKYLKTYGLNAYRDIYGGCKEKYSNDFYQDLISEDIAMNMYVRENISNVNNMTVNDFRRLQVAVVGNKYLTHVFCSRFRPDESRMWWDFSINSTDQQNVGKITLLESRIDGKRWDIGLESYLATEQGNKMIKEVHPNVKLDDDVKCQQSIIVLNQ